MPGGEAVSHSDILAAITARGGRLVASFEIDARGDTCDGTDHVASRCNGAGNPPRPRYQRQRKADAAGDWLGAAAKAAGDELAETKGILAALAEQRRGARNRR